MMLGPLFKQYIENISLLKIRSMLITDLKVDQLIYHIRFRLFEMTKYS